MAIIVKHKRTGNFYIWLSTDGGGDRALLPSRFLNDLLTREGPENSCLVALCDDRGNICLGNADELIVTEIDGQKPADILPPKPVTASVVNELAEDDFADDDFEQDSDFDRRSSQASEGLSAEETSAVSKPRGEVSGDSQQVASSSAETSKDEFDDDEDWI